MASRTTTPVACEAQPSRLRSFPTSDVNDDRVNNHNRVVRECERTRVDSGEWRDAGPPPSLATFANPDHCMVTPRAAGGNNRRCATNASLTIKQIYCPLVRRPRRWLECASVPPASHRRTRTQQHNDTRQRHERHPQCSQHARTVAKLIIKHVGSKMGDNVTPDRQRRPQQHSTHLGRALCKEPRDGVRRAWHGKQRQHVTP